MLGSQFILILSPYYTGKNARAWFMIQKCKHTKKRNCHSNLVLKSILNNFRWLYLHSSKTEVKDLCFPTSYLNMPRPRRNKVQITNNSKKISILKSSMLVMIKSYLNFKYYQIVQFRDAYRGKKELHTWNKNNNPCCLIRFIGEGCLEWFIDEAECMCVVLQLIKGLFECFIGTGKPNIFLCTWRCHSFSNIIDDSYLLDWNFFRWGNINWMWLLLLPPHFII